MPGRRAWDCSTIPGSLPQDDIARLLDCAPKTLRKRFRDELDRGVAEANAIVSGSLVSAAKAGNITAMIFWLKTRARWRERPAADGAAANAEAGPSSEVVLVLPDDSRDPELTQVLQDAQQKYFAGKHQRRQLPTSSSQPDSQDGDPVPIDRTARPATRSDRLPDDPSQTLSPRGG